MRPDGVVHGVSMTLYDFLPSGNGYKVRLLLAQLGLPFTLVEKDNTVVTVPVAPNADVRIGNRAVPLSAIRRNMQATTIHEGDQPATTVQATRQ